MSQIAEEQRKRGRPRVAEKLVPVTTWVQPEYARRLDALANQKGTKVSALVRHWLTFRIDRA